MSLSLNESWGFGTCKCDEPSKYGKANVSEIVTMTKGKKTSSSFSSYHHHPPKCLQSMLSTSKLSSILSLSSLQSGRRVVGTLRGSFPLSLQLSPGGTLSLAMPHL